MVDLRLGRSVVLVKGLVVDEAARRGMIGEEGVEGSLRLAVGGLARWTSDGVRLCKPLGRDRVEVDMDVDRER